MPENTKPRWKTGLIVGGAAAVVSYALLLLLPENWAIAVSILVGILVFLLFLWLNPATRFFRVGVVCVSSAASFAGIPRIVGFFGAKGEATGATADGGAGDGQIDLFGYFEIEGTDALGIVLALVGALCFVLQFFSDRRERGMSKSTVKRLLRNHGELKGLMDRLEDLWEKDSELSEEEEEELEDIVRRAQSKLADEDLEHLRRDMFRDEEEGE